MAPPSSEHPDFELFTSLRLDPILRKSPENSALNNGRDSPLYMSSHHQNRLLEAAEEFGFHCTEHLDFLKDGAQFEKFIVLEAGLWETEDEGNDSSSPLRVKFIFDRQGAMKVEFSPVPKVSLEALFPSTLDLPSDGDEEEELLKTFQPSPLTGGALNMGPTDFQPVPPPTASKSHSSLKPSYSILLDSQPTSYNAHTIFKTTHRAHYDSSRSRILGQNPSSGLAEEVLLYNTSAQIMEGSLTTPYFFRNGRWVTPPVWEDNHGGQRGTTRRYALEKELCITEAVSVKSLKNGEKIWISNGVRGFGWGHLILK